MAIASATSKNKKTIRLSTERWFHITESHDYMAGYFYDVLETINEPDLIITGRKGELLAAKFQKKTHLGPKHLIVVYKETDTEGFVITAFMTSKIDNILKKGIVWQKQ